MYLDYFYHYGGNRRRTAQLDANNYNGTSYRNLGNSQAIPDDNNVRIKIKNDTSSIDDKLNVWTNPKMFLFLH